MNIFDFSDVGLPNEICETICTGEKIRIERIVSIGQASPPDFWYDQNDDEWVILLQGTAKIKFFDDKCVSLKAGDYILIPANRKHRVEKTSTNPACIWLCIFGMNFK